MLLKYEKNFKNRKEMQQITSKTRDIIMIKRI